MGKINKNYIIAIDGGPATGKSTVADELSKRLGIVHIDTGAMFRTVAYYFIKNGMSLNENVVIENLDKIDINLKYDNKNNITHAYLNLEDVTDYIRSPEVSKGASLVSKIKEVRHKILMLERKMAEGTSVVLDGQDIGTAVFPDADFKFYFTASMEKRAKKRSEDLQKKGENVTYESTKLSLEKRDYEDKNRKESPVSKAEDAIEIDTTPNTKEETAEVLLKIIRERMEK